MSRRSTAVVIVSCARTPLGTFNGALSSLESTHLGALAIRAALDRCTAAKDLDVQEVVMGNVCTANLGQAPARQAARRAGLPDSVCATTINKVCASGMKAVMVAAQGIMTSQCDTAIAGGMESMSNVPYYLPATVRRGIKFGDTTAVDGVLRDGLVDAYDNVAMGFYSDSTAKEYGITREEQDQFTILSYTRAAEAAKNGYFKEIVPVDLGNNKGVISVDEEPKNLKVEKIPNLRPAFNKEEGTATAASSSKNSDGAAALVLMSEEKALESGVKPLARILGFADAERKPSEFIIAPALAIPRALQMAELDMNDIDLFEINEAFALTALVNAKILNIDLNKVNIYGGAVALGHPIGASGARIITTLISALHNKGKRYGVAAICNGGGGASAIVIERL